MLGKLYMPMLRSQRIMNLSKSAYSIELATNFSKIASAHSKAYATVTPYINSLNKQAAMLLYYLCFLLCSIGCIHC